MKVASKTIILSFLIVLTFSGFAQNKETRKLSSFSNVSVGESIQLYLIPGSKEEARIETTGTDTDNVITDVRGGDLRIRMDRGSFRSTTVKVWLTYRSLDGLDVSSSADAYTDGVIKAADFDLEVSSSGYAELELDVNSLDVEISSSGKADLAGSVSAQDVEVSSSGKLYAFNLDCKDLEIEANSSGKAEVRVTGSIKAEANSSGKVYYRGNPEIVMIDTNSSGKVSKAN